MERRYGAELPMDAVMKLSLTKIAENFTDGQMIEGNFPPAPDGHVWKSAPIEGENEEASLVLGFFLQFLHQKLIHQSASKYDLLSATGCLLEWWNERVMRSWRERALGTHVSENTPVCAMIPDFGRKRVYVSSKATDQTEDS